jgi:heme exporter protein C
MTDRFATLLSRPHLRRLAAPAGFAPLVGAVVPWFASGALLLTVAAMVFGLVIAPSSAELGDAYRIVFVHVPAAWMSLFLYGVMAGYAVLALAFDARLPAVMMTALAPTGAMFTFLALWTGSVWGRPAWAAWWGGDARLACEAILFLLYLGLPALRRLIAGARRADRACAVLVLVGALNLPIIYFSLQWWSTLHQGATSDLLATPSMARTMLAGMLVMALAFWMYANAVVLVRARCLMLEREAQGACEEEGEA